MLTCPASFHAQETVEKSGYRAYESFSMSILLKSFLNLIFFQIPLLDRILTKSSYPCLVQSFLSEYVYESTMHSALTFVGLSVDSALTQC